MPYQQQGVGAGAGCSRKVERLVAQMSLALVSHELVLPQDVVKDKLVRMTLDATYYLYCGVAK